MTTVQAVINVLTTGIEMIANIIGGSF